MPCMKVKSNWDLEGEESAYKISVDKYSNGYHSHARAKE